MGLKARSARSVEWLSRWYRKYLPAPSTCSGQAFAKKQVRSTRDSALGWKGRPMEGWASPPPPQPKFSFLSGDFPQPSESTALLSSIRCIVGQFRRIKDVALLDR